ncbi:hypothetical protein MHBO_001159 [Bonamia ostreae]|uniref:Uncharacterized protein n=1 Tax=Bonamia ostreae TaxID=126728 RepID=A0ABV2AIN2_9EUKA
MNIYSSQYKVFGKAKRESDKIVIKMVILNASNMLPPDNAFKEKFKLIDKRTGNPIRSEAIEVALGKNSNKPKFFRFELPGNNLKTKPVAVLFNPGKAVMLLNLPVNSEVVKKYFTVPK